MKLPSSRSTAATTAAAIRSTTTLSSSCFVGGGGPLFFLLWTVGSFLLSSMNRMMILQTGVTGFRPSLSRSISSSIRSNIDNGAKTMSHPHYPHHHHHHHYGRTMTQRSMVSLEESSQTQPEDNSRSMDDNNTTATTTTTTTTTSSISSTMRRLPHKKKKSIPLPPPLPKASEFPNWAYEPRDFFHFEILHESTKSQARVGRIHTPHGIIDTPSYVAVATNAALKGVEFHNADSAGQQLIFANTYHLLLHPGADIIKEAGGIHNFTHRNKKPGSSGGPFITDSGGFQVFSLAYGSVHDELTSKGELKRAASPKKRNKGGSSGGHHSGGPGKDAVKVTEEGATFRSYRDGSQFLLTPESTVQAQKDIGADIIIPLDELPPYHIDRDVLSESVDRSHRWEARSLQEHLKNIQNQAMYCVIHGGIDKEFRTRSIDYLTSLPFDGYAIGGSLGNGRQELKELLSWMMPLFDIETTTTNRKLKPRHLLGIADEESIWNAVDKGIDTLDSCYPTRIARHGTILVRKKDNDEDDDGDPSSNSSSSLSSRYGSSIKIKSGKYARSFGIPLDDGCQCSTCQNYDRAYLWHLFKANEPIATTLAAQHNIQYMTDLMARIRQDIMNDVI